MHCNGSQMTPQCVKNRNYDMRRSRVAWLLFFTHCDVFCDLLQYTHTEKCNLSVLFNKTWIKLVYWRIWGEMFGGGGGGGGGAEWKTINKSADVIWRGFEAICVCPLIDHGRAGFRNGQGGQLPRGLHNQGASTYFMKKKNCKEKCICECLSGSGTDIRYSSYLILYFI